MIFSRLGQAIPGVLLLGLVIFVHELGHFLMAKWRGVRVLRFSLGFGPKLVGFTRGETEYQLSWVPLGGYVQMAGDTPGEDGTMPGGREEFLSHPWFGRVMIAVAGPAANLVTAFVVLVLSVWIGETIVDYPSVLGSVPANTEASRLGLQSGDRIVEVAGHATASWHAIDLQLGLVKNAAVPLVVERGSDRIALTIPAASRVAVFSNIHEQIGPAIVGSVVTGMPAYKAGVKVGDRILAVDGRPISNWNDLPDAFLGKVDREAKLTILRDGRTIEVAVKPMDPEGRGQKNGRIGIEPPRWGTYLQRHPLNESLEFGVRATVGLVSSVYSGMWLTVSRPLYYREYVGGPLFIAQAAAEQARHGLDSYLKFIALINIAIMAFNLLPLPVLDGGHILLAVIEALRRQAISARAYVRFQKVGLAVLGTLLVLILANDPLRLVMRHRAIDQQSAPAARPAAPVNP